MRAPRKAWHPTGVSTAVLARLLSSKQSHNGGHSGDAKSSRWMSAAALLVAGVATAATSGFVSSKDELQSEPLDSLLDVFDQFEEAVRHLTGTDGREKSVSKALALFQKAAERGYAPAQYNLATLALRGATSANLALATDQKPSAEAMRELRAAADREAVQWLKRSAAQEDAESQFLLGLLCSIGRGTEQNGQLAMEWWQRAADQNFAMAQLRLASAYKPRELANADASAALDAAVTKVSDPTSEAVINSAGRPYALPDHARSASKCLYWLFRAARSGSPDAIRTLNEHGDVLSAAAGWQVRDFDQVVHAPLIFGDAQSAALSSASLATKGAAATANSTAAGSSGAPIGTSSTFTSLTAPAVEEAAFTHSPATEVHRLYQLGLAYRLTDKGSDAQKLAIAQLTEAAQSGYSLAQCELGAANALGLTGSGVIDDAAADRWFTAAANQGLPAAMYNLGSRALVVDDANAAFKWFARAAVRGEPQAQNNLGSMYCRGLGIEADADTGVRWLAYAARRGVAEAMYALGQAYEHGIGVDEPDLRAAAAWYAEAATRGVGLATTALANIRARMTRASAAVNSVTASAHAQPVTAGALSGAAAAKATATADAAGPVVQLAPLGAPPKNN